MNAGVSVGIVGRALTVDVIAPYSTYLTTMLIFQVMQQQLAILQSFDRNFLVKFRFNIESNSATVMKGAETFVSF
jgi:hypothetical protein